MKLLAGVTPGSDAVCMLSKPTSKPPAFPERRPPPRIGMTAPSGPMPIRRLKNISTCPLVPTAKSPAFSRKNGRFSGEEQVEAIEIDLQIVDFDLREVGVERPVQRQARRQAVFRRRRRRRRSTSCRSSCAVVAWPSTYGNTLRLR